MIIGSLSYNINMNKVRVFKTRIYASEENYHQFRKGFGTRRRVWNRGVDLYFNQGQKLSNFKLDTLLNSLIDEKPEELGWIKDVNTMVKSSSLKDFGLAVIKFHKEVKKYINTADDNKLNKFKPKFKKKKDQTQSFRLFNKTKSIFKILGNHTFNFNRTREYGRISVRTRESLEFLKDKDIKEMTILRQAGKYYIAICYEDTSSKLRQSAAGKIGLDLGVKSLYASYDGTEFTTFKKINYLEINHRIAVISQKLAKKKYDSKNYWKLVTRLQKRYKKATDMKKDLYYKQANWLCTNYSHIIIDGFSYQQYLAMNQVKGVVGRHKRIRLLQEESPRLFIDILIYQSSKFANNTIEFVKKGTPTTQTCSHCGHKQNKKIELKDRTFKCEVCGFTVDRDFNAAINTYNYS